MAEFHPRLIHVDSITPVTDKRINGSAVVKEVDYPIFYRYRYLVCESQSEENCKECILKDTCPVAIKSKAP